MLKNTFRVAEVVYGHLRRSVLCEDEQKLLLTLIVFGLEVCLQTKMLSTYSTKLVHLIGRGKAVPS